MPDVVLRGARPSDADAIAAIHLAARRDAMPWLPELHGDDEVRNWVGRVVLPGATVWVADAGDGPVGYMAIGEGSLDHLYVAPSHQGRGIGSRLLERAKELSPEGLQLYAFQSNRRARAFYEMRGFVARRFSDGADNEEKEPDVLYEWQGEAGVVDRPAVS